MIVSGGVDSIDSADNNAVSGGEPAQNNTASVIGNFIMAENIAC
jgi:hypothetical protein